MRFLPVLPAVAVALVVAAPAAAKELTKAAVCGPAGCIAVTDRATLRNFPDGGEELATQPPVQSFHELRFTVRDDVAEHTSTAYYVDGVGMIAWTNQGGMLLWSQVTGASATLMKELARGVKPFAAPTITAVTVGGRRVSGDPSSYLGLFEQRGRRLVETIPHDWVPIDFRAAAPSPWTDAPFELMYSPSTNAIERGIERIVLSESVAADVEAAGPLLASERGAWLPWLVLGGLVATLLLLAGLGALLRHRFGAAPTPEPAG